MRRAGAQKIGKKHQPIVDTETETSTDLLSVFARIIQRRCLGVAATF